MSNSFHSSVSLHYSIGMSSIDSDLCSQTVNCANLQSDPHHHHHHHLHHHSGACSANPIFRQPIHCYPEHKLTDLNSSIANHTSSSLAAPLSFNPYSAYASNASTDMLDYGPSVECSPFRNNATKVSSGAAPLPSSSSSSSSCSGTGAGTCTVTGTGTGTSHCGYNKRRKCLKTFKDQSPIEHSNSNASNGICHDTIDLVPPSDTSGSGATLPVHTSISTGSNANNSTLPASITITTANAELSDSCDPTLQCEYTYNSLLDPTFQCIRFHSFQPEVCSKLIDIQNQIVPSPTLRVDADKGFNFSNTDEAFVCQKKNHFQLSIQVNWSEVLCCTSGPFQCWPVAASGSGSFATPSSACSSPAAESDDRQASITTQVHPVDSFVIDIYGVRAEAPSQRIKIDQSQSDRSKRPFYPVNETTANNMRKKGRPNPDQRYFFLVVSLCARLTSGQLVILGSQASEKIIVRASNPGQFENDHDMCWQRSVGCSFDSIFHHGRVGINTDRPDEALTVHGNLRLTGALLQPSDERIKHALRPVDTHRSLQVLSALQLFHFRFKPEFGSKLNLDSNEERLGVLAQQLRRLLPEAVREYRSGHSGPAAKHVLKPQRSVQPEPEVDSLLMVDKERLLMECVAALQQLHLQHDRLQKAFQQWRFLSPLFSCSNFHIMPVLILLCSLLVFLFQFGQHLS